MLDNLLEEVIFIIKMLFIVAVVLCCLIFFIVFGSETAKACEYKSPTQTTIKIIGGK